MSITHQRADLTLTAALLGGATPHVWLHTGNPGAAGTANVALLGAGSIVRKPVSFGAIGNHPTNVERRVLSNTQVQWTGAEINSAQTITHFSIWSALTAGTPEMIAALAVAEVTGSDGVTINPGGIEVALGVFVRP